MSKSRGKLEHSKYKFTGKIFNLDGWIEQGVLLFNTYLTYGEHSENLWLTFTRFLVEQLSSECECLVFILACGDANKNFSNLIDRNKHEVINVYHPTHRSPKTRENLKWDVQLPFLRANEYFYRKGKPYLIDWEVVGKSVRMEKYAKYFKSLISHENEEKPEEEDQPEEEEEPEVEEDQPEEEEKQEDEEDD